MITSLLVISAIYLARPRVNETYRRFEEIHAGMKVSDVEAILGSRPIMDPTPTTPSWMTAHWYTDEGIIILDLDGQGHVIHKHWIPKPEPSPLDYLMWFISRLWPA